MCPAALVPPGLGVNLRDLFEPHDVPDGWYEGKRIAVDGHNVAFRYLTSFRSRDGDVLRNADGRPIGHLIGYLNLVRHLRERGAEPIIVWDGDVHPRKRETVKERIEARQKAQRREEDARQELALPDAELGARERMQMQAELEDLHAREGPTPLSDRALVLELELQATDVQLGQRRRWRLQESAKRHMRAMTYLDAGMIRDCTRLLESLGVAVVRADYDGERYAVALCKAGIAQAVATEDYDALVAGAPTVLRKAGSPAPFLHHLADMERHGLTLAQLRWVAILCGTDWHPGVKGLGAKTAVKMLREHPDLPTLLREAEQGTGTSRYHRLLAGMAPREFEELDAFIAALPDVQAPRAPKPDPGAAAEVAAQWGLDRNRTLACFC